MSKIYRNFDEIDLELRRLDLERKIAKEQIKSIKGDLKYSLQPSEWMQTGLRFAGKIGSMVLLKKIFR